MSLVWVPDDSAANQEVFLPAVGRDPVRGQIVTATQGDGPGWQTLDAVLVAQQLNLVPGAARWSLFAVGAPLRCNRIQFWRPTTFANNWALGIFQVDVGAGVVSPVSVTGLLSDPATGFQTVPVPDVLMVPSTLYAFGVYNEDVSPGNVAWGATSTSAGTMVRYFSRVGLTYLDFNDDHIYPAGVTSETFGAWGRGWFQ